jgi:N-acyl amino acid synthase of PEP-CTERM/exosortase system
MGGFDTTPSELIIPASLSRKRSGIGRECKQEADDLFTTYNRYFYAQPADSPELLQEAYRLRYQIYCVENAFEDPARYPDGLETDCFDEHSAHSLLIYRKSNMVLGTVRLILPSGVDSGGGLPMQTLYNGPLPIPVATTAEVSRFSISKELRRRLTDGLYPDENERRTRSRHLLGDRRILPCITLGLISALVQMSAEHRITHWCAVMMPTLVRVLARLGIHFNPVGPMVEHHGQRQPSFRNLDELLSQCRQERPDVWDVLTRKGSIWPPCQSLHRTQ